MASKAVVIGGGIAGTSIARTLARRGVQVTVVERANQLCAGATWHAAGLVTRFGGSPKIKKLHVQSMSMLNQLHDEHDVGLHLTGSIRLVPKGDRDRALEARHHYEMAKLYDDPSLPTSLLSPDEIRALHPLIDTSEIEFGLYTPKDGDIDPTLLTNCVAKLARSHGAEFRFNTEVTSVRRAESGEYVLSCKGGEDLAANIVVNAAGLWSQRFSQQLGLSHPAMVLEHHYAITESIAELGALDRVPVLRDLKGSSYIRQERTGLLIGPYEADCAVRREWKAGPPGEWAWDLFPENLDRLEESIFSAMELIPALQHVGFKSVVNGPTIWTGDSLPRCGRTLLPGYFDFNTLSYGIAHSLPLAEYLSRIILDGEQPFDMAAECDPLRYGTWTTDDFTHDKICETYAANNKPYFPFENRQAGREHLPSHGSALVEAFRKRGAVTGFTNAGVEVPMVFAPEFAESQSLAEDLKRFQAHAWESAAEAEAEHVRARVGLGYSSYSKLRVESGSSPAATLFLEKVLTNKIPKVTGNCRLTYAPTPRGRVVAEFTVTRTSADHEYYCVGSRDYAWHDFAWLEQQRRTLPVEEQRLISITNVTDDFEILHVAGPDSLAYMSAVVPAIANVGFLKMKALDICGVPNVNTFRVSYTGELGFELHVQARRAAELWEALWAHPATCAHCVRPFGSLAVNSLRIEKGFKGKADLDYALWTEAGIKPFVDKDPARMFLGRDADVTPQRESAIFFVEATPEFKWSVPSDCPVFSARGALVGFTTSSSYGTESRKTVALGYIIFNDHGQPLVKPGEQGLTVECFGNHFPVELLEAPPASVRGPSPKKKST